MSTQVEVATTIQVPSIMTANTYFWNPSKSASGRRFNEKKRTTEVANFLTSIGFQIIWQDNTNVSAKLNEIEVYFTYVESSVNVYKSLHITNKGLTSNITLLRKLLK